MPRPKKKPDYDAAQIMKDFMDTVAEAFGTYDDRTDSRDPGLNAVAAEFGITALKARKLLITAGVYSTALSRQIAELQSKKMKLEQIMSATGLSRASVHSYLPYTKIPYNLEELSVNAERIRLYRERKQKCTEFSAKLSTLTEREQTVVIARYGLDGSEPKPQREIARALGISRSYVSRIEKKALDKLKEYLKDYIHEI